ncbi:MAG: IS110 family transposase [Deinococcota bacterium]
MGVYIGIDLHSNNSVVVVVDDAGKVLYEKRLRNDLPVILNELSAYRKRCRGVVVESTYNWYWLVDGLMEAGYGVHLANTAAMQQYSGLKYSDDKSDARWLAEMLRLGVLPEGYIYPKEGRAVRDLLRKRSQLVRQKVSQMLSIQALLSRDAGTTLSGNALKAIAEEDLDRLLPDPLVARAAKSNLRVYRCIEKEVAELERAVLSRAKGCAGFEDLLGIDGIGKVLGLTILLEAGDMGRFAGAGNFASYCRCVGSVKLSNGKKKGKGNTKSGNKHLAWAFVEAANFAIRYSAIVRRFYERKKAKTSGVVAIKAVAHKLARAVYHVLKEGVPFQAERAFA